MASFKEWMDSFEYDPTGFDWARFRQAAEKAHADEVGIRDSKIKTLEEENGTLGSEVTRVKSKLFDLTMGTGASEQPKGATDPEPKDEPPSKTMDDLFKRE